ncbi:hypothetical protein FXN65_22015 [Metapseudomonas lalkuanensis]|uniref:Uncharacterized protein n=1 Tax=Metapseudomonas lalkuanensis TaxID=2604832 RepID=A0A5J6QV66_9GAMM|nr:hypothetical protein [Pseudomonas lalkuanensis]QEY64609.1 hypothetical protein FXN65_22015 [Pseudomonas lalkuanensis]UCO97160.1 hypothetical protein LF844_21180 [Pseudomonas lalkuanensis]
MRQPDIEIYLKDADQEAVTAWLNAALGSCTPWQQRGQTFKCLAGDVPVTWLPKAVGKWHSLYLESDATPWEDDLGCARAAFAALGVEIRCAPGGWQEAQGEEDADRWIKVNAEGEQEIIWRTD